MGAGLLSAFLMGSVDQGSYGNLWLWYFHVVVPKLD
jgi:hypothetical protein